MGDGVVEKGVVGVDKDARLLRGSLVRRET